jgi:hypothetical protein
MLQAKKSSEPLNWFSNLKCTPGCQPIAKLSLLIFSSSTPFSSFLYSTPPNSEAVAPLPPPLSLSLSVSSHTVTFSLSFLVLCSLSLVLSIFHEHHPHRNPSPSSSQPPPVVPPYDHQKTARVPHAPTGAPPCKDSRCCSCTNPKNQGLLIMQIMLQLYQFHESRLADYADHVAAVPIPRIKAC